jgi:hypothetical protein
MLVYQRVRHVTGSLHGEIALEMERDEPTGTVDAQKEFQLWNRGPRNRRPNNIHLPVGNEISLFGGKENNPWRISPRLDFRQKIYEASVHESTYPLVTSLLDHELSPKEGQFAGFLVLRSCWPGHAIGPSHTFTIPTE